MQRVVKELVEAVGLGDAIEICRRWGGRDFNVPVRVAPHDALALTLGYESAKKLVDALGGVRLQLPAERNALLDMRNAAIYRAVKTDGRSHQDVALEFGIRRQQVLHILRKVEESDMPFAGAGVTDEQ